MFYILCCKTSSNCYFITAEFWQQVEEYAEALDMVASETIKAVYFHSVVWLCTDYGKNGVI